MMLLALIFIFTLTAYLVLTYNRLSLQIANAHTYKKQIDIQLERRFKFFALLFNEVKLHIAVEHTMLSDVMSLHKAAEKARANQDEKTRMAAENQISLLTMSMGNFFEQYIDLKINARCTQLRLDLSSIENRFTYAKQAYNDSLEIYHANKTTFPANLLIAIFPNQLDLNFYYWENDLSYNHATESAYSAAL